MAEMVIKRTRSGEPSGLDCAEMSSSTLQGALAEVPRGVARWLLTYWPSRQLFVMSNVQPPRMPMARICRSLFVGL